MSTITRTEDTHTCEFCGVEGDWPTVFKAGPYWTHEPCLIKAVEEGRRS